jgi:hypothetical protein
MTLVDLMERLRTIEETALVDLLGLTSDDIVDRFADIIDDKFDYLLGELEELPDGEE